MPRSTSCWPRNDPTLISGLIFVRERRGERGTGEKATKRDWKQEATEGQGTEAQREKRARWKRGTRRQRL